ncbi:MAG: NUDIX hydrolase [Patescibacteria group bacterium]
MPKFVLIYVSDEEGRTLEHFYQRSRVWSVPAGKIKQGELPVDAAARELLERTGYAVDPLHLVDEGIEPLLGGEVAFKFKTHKQHLTMVARPGEQGGYATEIRWV